MVSTYAYSISATPSKQRRRAPSRPRRKLLPQIFLLTVVVAAVTIWNAVESVQRQSRSSTGEAASHLAGTARGEDKMNQERKNSPSAIKKQVTFQRSLLTNGTTPKTLALLYPPGLLGGYRNQVLRFIALVVKAKRLGASQLLLNSILWGTQLEGIGIGVDWFPVPMDWIFDIDYWNSNFADHYLLPRLVTDISQSDCWATAANDAVATRLTATYNISLNPLQRAALRAGSLSPIASLTQGSIAGVLGDYNPRSKDLLGQVQHCQNPVVYGGGIRAGRLWNDYLQFSRLKGQKLQSLSTNTTSASAAVSDLLDTDERIYRALQPAEKWRQVAEQCVQAHATSGRYVALHARVELEMMDHPCGKDMERNLTRIMHQVGDLLERINATTSLDDSISGLMIAVSRAGMEVKDGHLGLYNKYKTHADDNLATLNRLVAPGAGLVVTRQQHNVHESTVLPVFECGALALQEYYAAHPDVPDHGSLLQSVINFYLAVHANVFVGVAGSSYSTDVMTTRYHLGRGAYNYRYTRKGEVELVENGGLPQPHGSCKRKRLKS